MNDKEFLESIEPLMAKIVKDFLNDELQEVITATGFCIVSQSKGQLQDKDFDYYVDQWSTGTEGDSWEGDAYLRLGNGQYLKWRYRV